jgi:hypothetical protein
MNAKFNEKGEIVSAEQMGDFHYEEGSQKASAEHAKFGAVEETIEVRYAGVIVGRTTTVRGLDSHGAFVDVLVGVAAFVADGGEDPDPLFAFAHAASEFEPAPEAGDVGRVRALEGDQQRVAQRVAVEA